MNCNLKKPSLDLKIYFRYNDRTREGLIMAKKIKHGAQRPPLSGIDKFLYITAILLSLSLTFFSMKCLGFTVHNKILFSDPMVLWGNTEVGLICTMPIGILFFFPLYVFFFVGKQKRIPIIGNSKYKPKMFTATLKVYPLCSPQYMDNFTGKEKKGLRVICIYLGIALLLSILIYPLGLYTRKAYLENDVLCSYNMLNEETHRAHISGAESLIISTYGSGKHSAPSRIKLTIFIESRKYIFHLPRTTEAVEKALYIKSFFSPKDITIKTTGIKSVLRNRNWPPSALPLLYELYEYTP